MFLTESIARESNWRVIHVIHRNASIVGGALLSSAFHSAFFLIDLMTIEQKRQNYDPDPLPSSFTFIPSRRISHKGMKVRAWVVAHAQRTIIQALCPPKVDHSQEIIPNNSSFNRFLDSRSQSPLVVTHKHMRKQNERARLL